ncbi:MAG: GFA family protein [Pseudolabrys sp.]|nr:GFA family protein [Pseudolabrys sp.]
MTFHSGGCQCGAVRFRASKFGRASICHCRMCQKAYGSYVGALVTAHDLEWTRGAPAWFASSNRAKRGFCAQCGTPLSFKPDDSDFEVSCASFDDPRVVAPVLQVNPESKQPFFDTLSELPTRQAGAEPKQEAFLASVVNYQHPDHDTTNWPLNMDARK